MSASCSRVCDRYRALKPKKFGRYEMGQKRCNSCSIFIFWNGLWCPCCGDRLRLTPRSSKYKQKYLKAIAVKKEVIANGL